MTAPVNARSWTGWRAPLLLLAGIGAAGGAALLTNNSSDPDPARIVPATAVEAAPPATGRAPSFDVVRVAPDGAAVLAGRAEPGAQVVVRDGERDLGQVRSDQRGEWVLIPAAPLPAGGRELTLTSRTEAGQEAKADGAVLLVVPEPSRPDSPRQAEAPAAVAVLVPSVAAPRVLQVPPVASGERAGGRLGLDALDYDDRGEVRFAGSAPPNSPVRVYVDNAPAGDAVSDAQGRWTMTPREAVPPGMHRLRVDQLGPQGRVSARVELPFQRSVLPAEQLAGGRMIVQPGHNLWRLARRTYGSGARYTVIYQANRDQIRDPAMIYPGQVFALPAAGL